MDGIRQDRREMRKLGFVRFGRSSVARILKQHGSPPSAAETRVWAG